MPEFTESQNSPNLPVTSPVVSPNNSPSSPSSSWKGIIFGLFLIVCASIGAIYFLSSNNSVEQNGSLGANSTSSPTPKSTQLQNFIPVESASDTLVYISDNDLEQVGNEEVWLINPNTKKETKLPINDIAFAFKYFGQAKLFYSVTNDRGEYHGLDLSTGEDFVYDLLDHQDPSATVSINQSDINFISPDSKYMIFGASFFKPCPSPSPLPTGFEGGFGPCEPDESLETPSGQYLYDFASQKATYLGSVFRVSRWDTAKQRVYVTDMENGNKTKVIDLVNKNVSTIDTTESFGYFLYPLLSNDLLVKYEGATGNDGESPFSKIYLVKQGNNPGNTIDTSPTWTEVQPFITSSPNDSDVLYRRAPNINGIHHNAIYRYNLSTGKASRLSKNQSYLSYNIYVSWIDDHSFVTSVDPIEKEQFNNSNQYLVKIDLNTGEETVLTTKNDIQRFNTQ